MYKRQEPDPRRIPEALELIDLSPAAESGFAAVNATCAGVELARELVAAPPNVVTPAALADTAAGIAKDHGLELKVLERSDCEAKGMGAFLAVSQGSDLPPKFIMSIWAAPTLRLYPPESKVRPLPTRATRRFTSPSGR